MADRVSLIIEDLPMPQAPDTPIEMGRPRACTMISATVSATPEKFRKSRSVSLSGHISSLGCCGRAAEWKRVTCEQEAGHPCHGLSSYTCSPITFLKIVHDLFGWAIGASLHRRHLRCGLVE